jgi:hypothetical protein
MEMIRKKLSIFAWEKRFFTYITVQLTRVELKHSGCFTKTEIMIKKLCRSSLFLFLSLFFTIPCIAPDTGKVGRDYRIETGIEELVRMKRHEEFLRLRNDIRKRESSCRWDIINKIGAMGYYQFLGGTLRQLGYEGITAEAFRRDPGIFPPEDQDRAFRAYADSNMVMLAGFEDLIGQRVRGIYITRSGIIAAAHLAGPGGVIKFLTGKGDPGDIFHTRVSDYLIEFQGYGL